MNDPISDAIEVPASAHDDLNAAATSGLTDTLICV
jgi:hypothetical protein